MSSEAKIRLAEAADAEPIGAIYAPIVSETTISFETVSPSMGEMEDRIVDTTTRHPWLVCEVDSEVLGYAYARPHASRPAYRWTVDVSVYVRDDARRRGIATGCYESLFAVLEGQGFVTACAVIALPNEASVRLHEGFGFRPIGTFENVGYKLGAWRDVGWWQKALRGAPDNPDPPIDLPEARDAGWFDGALDRGLPAVDP